MITAKPIPHEQGRKMIEGKPAVTRAVFDRMLPELQARAMTITGIESTATIGRVRDIAARLPVGGDYDDVKAAILAELSPWLVTATDDEEREAQQRAAARRAETLLRMHGWQAYSQTQYELMEAHKDAFPYRQYLSREDGRERPTHKALHGKVLPADHPFWAAHTPPWEFGCRCRAVPLTARQAARIAAREAHLPPEARKVLPPEMLREVEAGYLPGPQGGRADIRTPREAKGAGHYEWRPGDARKSLAEVLASYPAPERNAFADYAEKQILDDGRSLMDWLAGEAVATAAPVAGQAAASGIAAGAEALTAAQAAALRDWAIANGIDPDVVAAKDLLDQYQRRQKP